MPLRMATPAPACGAAARPTLTTMLRLLYSSPHLPHLAQAVLTDAGYQARCMGDNLQITDIAILFNSSYEVWVEGTDEAGVLEILTERDLEPTSILAQ
ncbi:MAG: hypothetical protein ACOCXA_07055 [Planctomycetota bacterium]